VHPCAGEPSREVPPLRWLGRGFKVKRIILPVVAIILFGFLLFACAKQTLPEPESQGAQLYSKYCSNSGCHSAIPPQESSFPYWRNQYARWSATLKQKGMAYPSPQEDEIILAYLKKHARKSNY
jgi:predicted CxxxxCH...CXXCH cytochrome family protein